MRFCAPERAGTRLKHAGQFTQFSSCWTGPVRKVSTQIDDSVIFVFSTKYCVTSTNLLLCSGFACRCCCCFACCWGPLSAHLQSVIDLFQLVMPRGPNHYQPTEAPFCRMLSTIRPPPRWMWNPGHLLRVPSISHFCCKKSQVRPLTHYML
jgi:hypothetical protein